MSRPRVLVARLDSFGDVLVAGPAVRAVAAGASHVTMLCGPQGAPAADLLPGVDRVRVWAAPWVTETARPIDDTVLDEFRALVAEERPDEAVVLTSFHQSPLPLALLLRLAGVPACPGRRSTTPAHCSTSGSGPARTSPRTSPSRSVRCGSPRRPGSGCRRTTTGGSWSATTPSHHHPWPGWSGTWSSTPVRACRPGRGRSRTTGSSSPPTPSAACPSS